MIFSAFFSALDDVFERSSLKILLKGIALALGLLAAIFVVVAQLIGIVTPDSLTLPFIGPVSHISTIASWGAGLMMFALSPFLMAPVASVFIGLFIEDVADAVEERHYPTLPPVADKPLAQSMEEAIRFFGLVIVANLGALLLMVIPLFWPFAPAIFTGVNGYLLGREYFQMVASRRTNPEDIRALYEKNRLTIVFAGILMALPLAIPVVNLIVPVLGAATFTHLYHRITNRMG